MKLEIVRKKDMFCFETAFATICQYYNVPYQMLFGNTWGFDYCGNDAGVGNNICINDWDLLDKIQALGVIEEKVEKEKINDVAYVQYMIKQGKIAIAIFEMDKFNEACGYSYIGLKSPYLIYDYKDGFIAYDLHYTHDILTIPDRAYAYSCDDIVFYCERQGDKKYVFEYRMEDINKILVPNHPNFEKMEQLAKLFYDGTVDLEYETKDIPEGENPVYAPLINKMETLARGRNLFSIYLNYVNSMIEEIEITDAYNKMAYWAGRWNLVKAILIKDCYMRNFHKGVMKNIGEIIQKIAEGEQELYKQLIDIDYCKKRNRSLQAGGKVCEREVNPITINLSSYYNNAGVRFVNSDKKSDMTGLGAYIQFEEEEVAKAVLKHNDSYGLYHIVKMPLDNILCQEQEINMPRNEYNRIHILGCSEYGSFSDYLIIRYEDQTEKVIINFSSWINRKPLFNDEAYCTGQLKEIKQRLYQETGTLFTQSIELQNKKLCSIKLPNCPTMHIFSIYLN